MADKDTRQGFDVRTTARGHAQVRNAVGEIVAVFSGTPGDVRALRNGIAALRRAGFVWPPKR